MRSLDASHHLLHLLVIYMQGKGHGQPRIHSTLTPYRLPRAQCRARPWGGRRHSDLALPSQSTQSGNSSQVQ